MTEMNRLPCVYCGKIAHNNKGKWTKEEDERLIAAIQAHGEGRWKYIPKAAGILRCGLSCRARWMYHLRPDIKRGRFTEEEDDFIIKLHSIHGDRWSVIANKLPGRTPKCVRHRWLSKKLKEKLLSRVGAAQDQECRWQQQQQNQKKPELSLALTLRPPSPC